MKMKANICLSQTSAFKTSDTVDQSIK